MSYTCFDFRNRVSDFLDQKLNPVEEDLVQLHLDTCPKCEARRKHYIKIIELIASQPKHPMPVAFSKAPLTVQIPKSQIRNPRTRWEKAPWFVRTGVEGFVIALSILAVVVMVPKVRNLYEQRLEHRLDEYGLEEVELTSKDTKDENAKIPLGRGRVQGADGEEFAGGENAAENESAESDDGADDNVNVGNSEIWRFNIKTDSPKDLRPKVVQTLMDFHVSQSTPGFGGIEAPGGIQFDILLPKGIVVGLRNQLKHLATSSGAHVSGAAGEKDNDVFTWYKSKSRRGIPPGKARVVIWLSQI